MNAENSRPMAVRLATVCLFAFAAGCTGVNAPTATNAAAAGNAIPQSSLSAPAARYQGTSSKRTAAFFVSNLGTSVRIYPTDTNPSAPQPLATLTQEITQSNGIWVDKAGTTYVVNGCCTNSPPSVVAFRRGQTTPSLQIVNGLSHPTNVAVDTHGTVYVTDTKSAPDDTLAGILVLYKRGQISPEATITLPDAVYGLEVGSVLFDAAGNTLVATLNPGTNTYHIFRIPRGSRQPVDTGIQGAAGDSLALDGAGNLYTANASSTTGEVATYAPGATTPTRTYSLGPQILAIAVASDGTLYATTSSKGVLEVAPRGDTVEKTFAVGGAGITLGRY
jgi:hypothetical protein